MGSFVDQNFVTRGFPPGDGEFTVMDSADAAGTILRGISPNGDVVEKESSDE